MKYPFYILFVIVFINYLNANTAPNIIVILTDDQDIALGGMNPMENVRSYLADKGAEFSNMFVTTPLCCPSRASILTGRYARNHGVRNNSIDGNCNSLSWQKNFEARSFITKFKQAGYSTFYGGKYLNQYGKEEVGGVEHIPTGWDHWVGLVGNSCYYNYSLSINGKKRSYGSNPNKDYLTDVVFHEGIKFLHNQNASAPFFMFLSPPAPHAPFIPSPKYENKFSYLKAPRTHNFAIPGGKQKHWLLQQPPNPLPNYVIDTIDDVFRNRWRTLLSIDDYIPKLIDILKRRRFLDNTYVFFTSDNGFHLGQFSLPWDKRQPYEFDIRVPLLVRGPGIKYGIKLEHPVLNIDLAPTFLELANLTAFEDMDGESFAVILKNPKTKTERDIFLIEHIGEYLDKPIKGCPKYQPGEVNICEIDCICEDSKNNTYNCLRELSKEENYILCFFKDDVNFGEAYNISDDPFQMKNMFNYYEKQISFTKIKHLLKNA